MIRHYLKVAFRNLLRYKTQNLISTIGLAVGLLCFSICFYCSRYMQSMDQCFDNYHRLVDIRLVDGEKVFAGTPAILAEKLMKEGGHEVEAYSRVSYSEGRPFNVYLNDEKKLPFAFDCMEVDSFYNRLFTPDIMAGSWIVAAHTPNAVVLTESAARKSFPLLQDAIGKRLVMTCRINTSPETTPRDGGITYTIQAVIKDTPTNISMSFMQKIDALILNDSEGLFAMEGNNNMTGTYTYALLKEGQTAKNLEERYRKVKLTHRMFDKDNDVVASPIGKEVGRSSSMATIFGLTTSIVGILILLVSLLNFFHFQIGSVINRQREFSIRKVLGNDTVQLSMMLFTQLFLVIMIASLFMFGSIEILSSHMQISLFNMNMAIDRDDLIMQGIEYLVILLVATLIICFSVSFYIRKVNIQAGISSRNKRKGHFFRNTMLGIQFFICWLFVSMTVALYLQTETTTSTLFNTLTKTEKRSILSLKLDYTFMKNEEKLTLIERIRKHSGVKDILLADSEYLDGVSRTGMQFEKNNPDKWIEVNVMDVSPNFASFMNVPLLAGRDMESESDMLVDEVFKEKTGKDVLGMPFYNYQNEYAVCGILSSFNPSVYYRKEEIGFVFIPSNFTDYVGHCYIKCYPGKEKEVTQWIMQILKETLPESIEPKVSTFLEDIKEEQALETKLKDIILFFSIVSLIITLLGVYAAITLDTERRQKEVAIRKVNGAGMKQIILLFARLYLLLLAITAILAFPIVYFILQIWKEMYQVFFNDGILYWGSIFIGVTLLTVITVIFRILKIARLNPAEIIKNE